MSKVIDTSKLTLQQKLSIEYIEDSDCCDDDFCTRELKDYLKSERMAKERKEKMEGVNKE